MEISIVASVKLFLVDLTGLSKDTLHVYAGLTVFVLLLIFWRKNTHTCKPLVIIFIIAGCAEIIDMVVDLNTIGYWRWRASIHDFVNTIFWSVVFWGLIRFGVVGINNAQDKSINPQGHS